MTLTTNVVSLELRRSAQKSRGSTRPRKKPLPDCLKIIHTPPTDDDFRQYLDKMYPFVVFQLRFEGHGQITDDLESIANEFSLYLLSNDRHGTPRWQLYDATRASGAPYFKWFLAQTRFFIQQYNERNRRIASREVGLPTMGNNEDRSDTAEPGRISLSKFREIESENQSVEPVAEAFEGYQLSNLLRDYLTQVVGDAINPRSFEAHSLRLFDMLVEGESHAKVAQTFGISRPAIGQWRDKLAAKLIEMMPDIREQLLA